MYSEQYPFIYKAFPFENFEVILETVEKYFGNLFNLQIIEQELKHDRDSGSYLSFFTSIVKQLEAKPGKDLSVPEQITQKIYSILHADSDVRDRFLTQLVFVPDLGNEPSLQLGFQEKLASGRLGVPEPLTMLDMLRITFFFQNLGSKRAEQTEVAVLNLASTEREEFTRFQAMRALVVNLNLNPKDIPKWAVIDWTIKDSPKIYCENPLSERERRELEARFGSSIAEVKEGGRANNLISTGYSAIAWLDQKITRGWNFDTNADFNVVFGDFALTIFEADVGGVHFKCVGNEYDQYVTDGLKQINTMAYGNAYGQAKDPQPGSKQWGAYSLYRLAGMATLKDIEGESVPYNDLAKVIEIVGRHNLSVENFEKYSGLGYRSRIPRFAHTLSELDILKGDKEDKEETNEVTLTIPNAIDISSLDQKHLSTCITTNTDPSLIRFISRVPPVDGREKYRTNRLTASEEDVAAAMVLTLFRSRAKKPILTVYMPKHYQLNDEERQAIVALMQDNAFVTELNINNDNDSLNALKAELLPVFARNRWLKDRGYLPPLVDDYWLRAAKYWLTHLNEHNDVLTSKNEHVLFKGCVEEMGIRGLKAVLSYLKDPQKCESLLNEYGSNRPAFYVACQPEEVKGYLELLIQHLQHGATFPFDKLGVAYQPGSDLEYSKLLGFINKNDSFDMVQLTDCLKHEEPFASFLETLSEHAKNDGWTGLIVIPELEDKANTGEEYRELRALYRQLNNVILHNRHVKQGTQQALRIQKVSQFEDIKPSGAAAGEELPVDEELEEITLQFADTETGPWPLQRGGVTQLQLQQQQEIQQERQVQQEQQKMKMLMLDEVISSELVTYDSIDKLLGEYYKRFAEENDCDPKYAALRNDKEETLLQGFFHTWINANPKVAAAHVIQSMTQDAARMLLRHHTRVTSGLHLENLPKGFYTQRSKSGGLILCYNPEVGFGHGFVSPLTLSMTVSKPVAEAWEGDFRFLDIDYYEGKRPLKEAADFRNLLLFEALQPPRNYDSDYARFCAKNPTIKTLIGTNGEKVTKHWLVFLQAWQYLGEEGVKAFLHLNKAQLTLTSEEACDMLLSKQAEVLVTWAKEVGLGMDEQSLRALGQVYYRHGNKVLALLLTKLKGLEKAVGKEFFLKFKEAILDRTDTFNSFANNPAFFSAMDNLIARFSSVKTKPLQAAFLSFCNLHLDCVPWETTETLWNAFDYFSKALSDDMGLELSGEEFNKLRPQNMLVGLDRILASLRALPGNEERVKFLKSLDTLDLTQGGVHYAIQREHMKYCDEELRLRDFESGTPTYAPNLSHLYAWTNEGSTLNIKRVLASRSQFSHEDYKYLSQEFATGDLKAKDELVCLLYTQCDSNVIEKVLSTIRTLPVPLRTSLGQHLHTAVFKHGHEPLQVSLEALVHFKDVLQSPRGQQILEKYPHGNFLEALSILFASKQQAAIEAVLTLFETARVKDEDYPDFLFHDAYKLATLFGAASNEQFEGFISATSHLKLAVQHELHLLIKYLLSVDYTGTTNLKALTNPEDWNDLLQCVTAMNERPNERTALRHALIKTLTERGIVFRFSKSGDFRKLEDADYPSRLNVFTDHQKRMWSFLKSHIVVPGTSSAEEAEEALKPLLAFFERLQLNRTYLNEVEPLLAILEKTKEGVWSSSYFSQMIGVLKPDDEKVSFPLDMLQVMLEDEVLKAKPIDNAEKDFPSELLLPLKSILSNQSFSRGQHAQLCQLALKEYYLTKTNPLLSEAIDLLSPENRAASRDYALQSLITCKNTNELTNRLDKLKKLLNHARSLGKVGHHWENTAALWINAIAKSPAEDTLFNSVYNSLLDEQADKRAKLLHVVAWSSLHRGLQTADEHSHSLAENAPKLTARLLALSDENLNLLADCYPKQPCPGASDILQMLKKCDQGREFSAVLQAFLSNPHPEVRADYQQVAKTRQADLRRMLTETRLIEGKESQLLHPAHVARISVIFSQLKQLETGEISVEGSTKAVSSMSQDELAEAFNRLSLLSVGRPQDDVLQAQIWALLFEALGRTTRKYPHMAQQFALIANDIAVTSPTRVLQLATGEGKSHFVALRAARHAAQGKVVDVCTAKRSLAQRDLEDYQDLYKYLNLTATYIEPKSSREAYLKGDDARGRIHYSTLGDLSLFLDEQSFNGRPIIIDPNNRVGLGDELDFIYFDEGRKTEYNYARPTGRTPKQMMWFYQALNSFYKTHAIALKEAAQITPDDARQLLAFLQKEAGEDEDKEKFVRYVSRDGLQLIRWLQSAHEADGLEQGVGFTVREENVRIGDAAYLLKEIIPLSTDNQKIIGSSFSAGVHQLLAVRLNTAAKNKVEEEPQNYHVHAESHIISSQVAAKLMSTLWGRWEGFTGTISFAQAEALHQTQRGTQVLQVSTNQRDLRFWHAPKFREKEEDRIKDMVAQLRLCMEKKQSILFSCQNDKKVLELKAILEKELSAKELSQLIFYTNEDPRSSTEILKEKEDLEKWQGGKKQQAIGLVASGFGRGDNVGVEAVFLFDANDINDLKQKGGRTARNGEEGEVFQFYLTSDMKEEEKKLENAIKGRPGVNWDEMLKESLEAAEGNTADEKCFNRIMLLREYQFNLDNAANQGYRVAVAHFSGWGMQLIGTFLDPTQASDFTSNLTNAMRQLEKRWLSISSEETLTPTQKVRKIEEAIKLEHKNLEQEYSVLQKLKKAPEFNPEAYPEISLKLSKPVIANSTNESRDVASLCALFASLPTTSAERESLATFPNKLERLTTNPMLLRQFMQDAAHFSTVAQFMDQLSIRLEQLDKPAKGYAGTLKEAEVKPNTPALFQGVKSQIKEGFFTAVAKLTPALQEGLDSWLKAPGIITARARIEKALPLARYLASFSKSEQERWGEDYLHNFDTLWHHAPEQALAERLSGIPMSYNDSETLWSLATHYAPANKKDTFLALQQAIETGSSIQRLRLLTRCEGLLNCLPLEQRAPFFNAFIQVMTQFKEGRDWDTFVMLTDKTARWWNTNDGQHRSQLMALWQQLAGQALPQMAAVMNGCLLRPGKAWFQVLELSLSVPAKGAKQLSADHWWLLHQLLVKQSGKQALGKHFTPESRKVVLASLNALLDSWSTRSDFTQQVKSAFETYALFLQKLIHEAPINVAVGASWYLDCLRQTPDVRIAFDNLVAAPDRMLHLDKVVGELSRYPFTSGQGVALLDMAKGLVLSNDDFSLSCQIMANTAKVLTETSLLNEEEKARIDKTMQSLPAEKLFALLRSLDSYPNQLKANPRVLSTLLKYANNNDIEAARVERLTKVLLQVAGTSTQAPDYLDHLIKGVNRFQDAKFSIQDIERLLVLLQGDDALAPEQVLFDNLARYLENNVSKGQHQAVKSTIDLFYSLAKTHRGDVERMFSVEDNAALKEMFDFKQQREALHNQRVIWMHLLNNEAFVTGGGKHKELDSHVFQWSSSQNQDMLQRGLNCYLAETKLLLARKPMARLGLERDLSTTQQHGLLRLANELAIIGKPQLTSSAFADIRAIEKGLTKLEKNYQAGWLKTDSRKQQFTILQQAIHNELARNPVYTAESRYESVLAIIRKARLQAMRADIVDNKSRVFLLNRNGHSRYFSTLNQMEDLLVRHWVKDVNAIQQFQNYTTLCQQDLLDLTGQLYDALKIHYEKTQETDAKRYKKFGARIGGLFASKNKDALQALRNNLYRFNNDTLTDKSLEGINGQIQKSLSKLPGHLQTLAREVLMRSDALTAHLDEKARHPTKPIIR